MVTCTLSELCTRRTAQSMPMPMSMFLCVHAHVHEIWMIPWSFATASVDHCWVLHVHTIHVHVHVHVLTASGLAQEQSHYVYMCIYSRASKCRGIDCGREGCDKPWTTGHGHIFSLSMVMYTQAQGQVYKLYRWVGWSNLDKVTYGHSSKAKDRIEPTTLELGTQDLNTCTRLQTPSPQPTHIPAHRHHTCTFTHYTQLYCYGVDGC